MSTYVIISLNTRVEILTLCSPALCWRLKCSSVTLLYLSSADPADKMVCNFVVYTVQCQYSVNFISFYTICCALCLMVNNIN